MSAFISTFQQLSIMFLLAGFGYFLYKKNFISDNSIKELSSILVYLVIPVTIINSLQNLIGYFDWRYVLQSMVINIAMMLLSLLVTRLFFPKKEQFLLFYAALFSNAGFIGIPLVQAVIGSKGMVDVAMVLLVSNFFVFTYGIYLQTGNTKALSRDRLLRNPGIILPSLGLVLYLLNIEFPLVVNSAFQHIANMNSPLAMMILGCYLAQSQWKATFSEVAFYKVAFVRLLAAPLLCLLFLWILPFLEAEIKMALLIAYACPTAVHTFILSREFGNDPRIGAQVVMITTLLSLLSIPALAGIGSIIF